jgi:choline dehydrogenase
MTKRFDTVVVGAGSAGAAIAAKLIETTSESVLLLEAGPDYGPFSEGRWPFDLLNFRALPGSPLRQVRGIGGSSSGGDCAAIWGSRIDYDGWARLGLDGWAADDLLPLFEEADQRLRVIRYSDDELTPFQRGWLEAAPRLGIHLTDNLNDLDEDIGIGAAPVNVAEGVRWNTAFAFIDAVRRCERLAIQPNALVDHLVVEDGRAVGVVVFRGNERRVYKGGRIVVAAGAYGSPAILQRSGIGDPDDLGRFGIPVTHELVGVGSSLQDHPSFAVGFAGTPELEDAMRDFAERRDCPEAQAIAKARSTRCEEGFDLHLRPIGGFVPGFDDEFRWSVIVANMTPVASGSVTVQSRDPADPPLIESGFLSDPQGRDAEVLVDGIELARQIAAAAPLAGLLGPEIGTAARASDRDQLLTALRAGCRYGFHPVGTCKMGPVGDPGAVVDQDGRVHGLEGLWVGDCSILPSVPRANSGVPAVVAGLRVASGLTR